MAAVNIFSSLMSIGITITSNVRDGYPATRDLPPSPPGSVLCVGVGSDYSSRPQASLPYLVG